VIAFGRDNSEDSSVQTADATNDRTRQVQEMALDASRKTHSRVGRGPRPEQSHNANSDESSARDGAWALQPRPSLGTPVTARP
jgi:hypothetical protein